MINQSFTYNQFKKLQKRGDFLPQNVNTQSLKLKLLELEELLKDINQFSFSSLKNIKKNHKEIYFLDKKIRIIYLMISF